VEAVAAATKLENTIMTTNKAMPAHNDFYGRESPNVRHLCTFGEFGIMHYANRKSGVNSETIKTPVFYGLHR